MSDRVLASGAPVPADNSHTQLKPNGQQRDYIVLSEAERAKGFVKPVRMSYIHIGRDGRRCGGVTLMGLSIAETYARNPKFYSGTFCCRCGAHFDLNEFEWEDGEPMEPTLQDAWHAKQADRERERRHRRADELRRDIQALQAELQRLES